MKEIYLKKIDPDDNTYRFYRLVLGSGSRDLMIQWGRIGDYLREKWDPFPSHAAAKERFEKLEREKKKEGYETSSRAVMPKNYLFYDPPSHTVKPDDGQLSFLSDDE